MQIKSLLSEIKSELNKIELENIPNVLFFSFKSVSNRLAPISDHSADELPDETKSELQALLTTIQNFIASEDQRNSCMEVDSIYQYQLIQ